MGIDGSDRDNVRLMIQGRISLLRALASLASLLAVFSLLGLIAAVFASAGGGLFLDSLPFISIGGALAAIALSLRAWRLSVRERIRRHFLTGTLAVSSAVLIIWGLAVVGLFK